MVTTMNPYEPPAVLPEPSNVRKRFPLTLAVIGVLIVALLGLAVLG